MGEWKEEDTSRKHSESQLATRGGIEKVREKEREKEGRRGRGGRERGRERE